MSLLLACGRASPCNCQVLAAHSAKSSSSHCVGCMFSSVSCFSFFARCLRALRSTSAFAKQCVCGPLLAMAQTSATGQRHRPCCYYYCYCCCWLRAARPAARARRKCSCSETSRLCSKLAMVCASDQGRSIVPVDGTLRCTCTWLCDSVRCVCESCRCGAHGSEADCCRRCPPAAARTDGGNRAPALAPAAGSPTDAPTLTSALLVVRWCCGSDCSDCSSICCGISDSVASAGVFLQSTGLEPPPLDAASACAVLRRC